MSALERYKRDVHKPMYLVHFEPWFRAAMCWAVRVDLKDHQGFKDAPDDVLDMIAHRIVDRPENDREAHTRKLAHDTVWGVLHELRRAGIVPVPLK